MNNENDKYLSEKYPKMFRDRYGDMKKTCMVWGFECGDGWFTLLDELCRKLQWNTDKNGYPQVVAVQVKEKFGGLRFYYTTEGGKEDSQADYRFGEISGVIDFAEVMSYKICELCGNTKGVTTTKGWNMTRCAECTAKKEEEKK